jgi:hypothetical protein
MFEPLRQKSRIRKKGESLLRKTFFDFFDFAVFSSHNMAIAYEIGSGFSNYGA